MGSHIESSIGNREPSKEMLSLLIAQQQGHKDVAV